MTSQNSLTPLAKADRDPTEVKILSPALSSLPPKKPSKQKSQGLGLRAKTTLTAIALGVIPLTTIGAISYKVTQGYLVKQINRTQQSRATHLSHLVKKYLNNRVNESETLATNPIFTNPNIMGNVTLEQKKAALDSFQSKTGFYDNIVYLDLQGNPLFQSRSERPLRSNYSQQKYFQAAIAGKTTTLNELGKSSYTGEPRIEFVVPVKQAWTDEVIGAIRFRIPSQSILPLFKDYIDSDEQWYVINTGGLFFANSTDNLNDQPFANYFPQLQESHVTKETATEFVNSPLASDRQQIINYAPVKLGAINPNLNIGTAIALDTDIAFAPLKSLKWIYVGGTIGTIFLIASIAGFLANQIVQPLLKLTATVDELRQGKLNTKVKLNRQDELGILGDRINDMATQLDRSMQRQKTQAKSSELIARIAQARSPRELQLPLSMFLAEVRDFIQSDRVVFYQFDPQWRGTVVAESVAVGFTRTLGVQFEDPCFAEEYVRKYKRGRIQSISNIYEANLSSCHLEQLEPYEVKASLVLPIILECPITRKSEKLAGLLIAHQCSNPRVWSQSDLDYFQQIAYQLATVLGGYIVDNEESSQKANIQQDIEGILSQLEDVAQGDLTLKVNNKANYDRDLRKLFDAVLNNLRQTIAEIRTPSKQINQKLAVDRDNLVEMKDRLKQQANQLALIFSFIEQISDSIAEVSSEVGIASHTVDSVVTELESEKANFEHAISFMSQLEGNLRDNKDKVKNLSAASVKMTRVINSIKKINLRTSLLASKFSQKIPELDESAFGLKEEISSIQQSIAATKELEIIALNIDREINEVLHEYQKNENKLEQENYLVSNASKNLDKIVKVTKNAQQNLFSLVNMTKSQQHTCRKVDNLRGELNSTAESITLLNNRTIQSVEATSITANDLENVIDFFKLEQKTLGKSQYNAIE